MELEIDADRVLQTIKIIYNCILSFIIFNHVCKIEYKNISRNKNAKQKEKKEIISSKSQVFSNVKLIIVRTSWEYYVNMNQQQGLLKETNNQHLIYQIIEISNGLYMNSIIQLFLSFFTD